MYSIVSAEPKTTTPFGRDAGSVARHALRWKNSSWKSRIRRTSFGVSVAATMSGRCRTTHSYASSGSKIASGGVSDMRAASRNTKTAAMARMIPTTMNPTSSATASAYGVPRGRGPERGR